MNCQRVKIGHQCILSSVYAVVLHFGSSSITWNCLQSLRNSDYPRLKVLLVDNDPLHRFPLRFASQLKNVEVLDPLGNLGYSAACNTGIREALLRGADFVWLLNNDTVVKSRSLTSMLEVAQADAKVAVVGSSLFHWHDRDKLQAWGGGTINFLTGLPSHLKKRRLQDLDYICGASMLIRSRTLRDVGLLDEGFSFYWEDVDLCYRMRLNGWKLAVADESVVFHFESASSSFQSTFYDYHFSASSIRFFRKHCRFWIFPVLISMGGRIVRRTFVGKRKSASAVFKAFLNVIQESMTGPPNIGM